MTAQQAVITACAGARSAPAPLSRVEYRRDIDGLRAVAILSVVGFHAFSPWVPGGFIGVDIFFVISGFLISTLILKDLEAGAFSFPKFYARRVRRLFPALGVVLVACLMLGWVSLTPAEYEQLGKHMAAGAAFVANFIFWKEAGYFDNAADTKPLLHLWSLGIEEQFYLFWPPLLYFLSRNGRSLALTLLALIGASFGFSMFAVTHDVVADFYSPLTRLWELLLGAGLAYALMRNPDLGSDWRPVWSWAGLLLILIATLAMDKKTPFPGAWVLLPTAGAACLILGGKDSWLNRRVLSATPLVWVGLISYPLYLWHWPLLSFFRILESETPSAPTRIAIVLMSVLLAALTYRLVERPVRFGPRSERTVALLCGLMLTLLIAGLTIRELDGLKFRNQSLLNGDPGTLKLGADRASLRKECGIDESLRAMFDHCLQDPLEEPRYVALGDSKAEALFYGLERESKPNNRWMLIGSVKPPDLGAADRNQPRQVKNAVAFRAIEQNANIKVVVLTIALRSIFTVNSETGFVEGDTAPSGFAERVAAYSRAIQGLEKAGKRVVFVVDNPTLPSPRNCIGGGLTPSATLNKFLQRRENPRCAKSYTEHLRGTRVYREFIEKLKQLNPALIVYDPARLLCDIPNDVCSVRRNGNFLYSYSDHISDYGNSLVARDLLPVVYKIAN